MTTKLRDLGCLNAVKSNGSERSFIQDKEVHTVETLDSECREQNCI